MVGRLFAGECTFVYIYIYTWWEGVKERRDGGERAAPTINSGAHFAQIQNDPPLLLRNAQPLVVSRTVVPGGRESERDCAYSPSSGGVYKRDFRGFCGGKFEGSKAVDEWD